MNESWKEPERVTAADQAVGIAIQDLMATRLARGFVPLVAVCAAGVLHLLMGGGGGLLLATGAIAAAGTMLAYGLRITQRAFGRTHRVWMSLALMGGIVPPLFSVYVFGGLGLRGFVGATSAFEVGVAALFTLAGLWSMRSWMKIVEMGRLAEAMALGSGLSEG